MAKNEDAVKNDPFGFGESNPLGASFVGESYLKTLVADPAVSVNVSNVSFEPASRTNWHVHTEGYQILLVTRGEGWYQEEGAVARRLSPGDVAVARKGVKHWHGAAQDSWFSHIVVTAGATEFLEPVTDEHYGSL